MSHCQSCLLVAAMVIPKLFGNTVVKTIVCMLTIMSYLLHQQNECKILLINVCYAYGCDNDIILNSSKSQVIFLDTIKYGHMKNIMLGQKPLNVTKSYNNRQFV